MATVTAVDWTQIIVVFLTALPPTLMALANFRRAGKAMTVAQDTHRIVNSGADQLAVAAQTVVEAKDAVIAAQAAQIDQAKG